MDGHENATGMDRVFDELLSRRIVFLGGEVTDESAAQLSARLLLLAAEDDERDIQLYINSPGGSVTAGFAVYDCMSIIRPDVATVAIGLAGSMGQFLLSSGAPGKRFALPNARIVMHQPHGGYGGTASDITTQAEQIVQLKYRLAELTSAQTGRSIEQIIQDGDRDRWFTAQEALDYGFVDRIVPDMSAVTG